jgi:hypothetical protein
MNKRVITGVAILLSFLAATAAVAPAVLGQSAPTPALPIPQRQLEAGGLQLAKASAADVSGAHLGRDVALQRAQEAIAGRGQSSPAVKDVVLARVSDAYQEPPLRCLCWVVSLDPSGMVFYGPTGNTVGYQAGYSVIVIDAQTGDPLFWRTGGEPPK